MRYETGGSHSWSGVDFQQMNLIYRLAVAALALTDDVVDTYDAVAVENVVDMTGEFGRSLGSVLAEASWSYFLHLSVVLGVVVEELVVGHHLCCR